jgi:nicotinate-nucleotide pyrophosphorylase (carboxylating)
MDERSIVGKNFEALLASWTVEDPFYGEIFRGIEGRRIEASLRSRSSGWTAGIPFAKKAATALGLEADWRVESGNPITAGEEIGNFQGRAEQIFKFENLVIGLIAKPSGIATAAQEAKKLAAGRIRLVAGGWKKHPFLIKEQILEAIRSGGIGQKILEEPFIYLDKNYVRILGGIAPTLQRAISFSKVRVIQLRGEFASIAEEAEEAISCGADVLMVDTGSWGDLDDVLREAGKRGPVHRVRIAFAGGIKLKDIPMLVEKGVDILDIGRAILDAPWLDLTYDVVR